MVQASLDYSAPPERPAGKAGKLGAVAWLFHQRPNQWISALDLAAVGGMLSSRTRISECRTVLGMTIENRTFRVNGELRSEYRWVA